MAAASARLRLLCLPPCRSLLLPLPPGFSAPRNLLFLECSLFALQWVFCMFAAREVALPATGIS